MNITKVDTHTNTALLKLINSANSVDDLNQIKKVFISNKVPPEYILKIDLKVNMLNILNHDGD